MYEMDSPLERLLDPGERLLWSGQPKQGLRLQAADLFLIPFSLLWGGFAIFWEVMALGIVSSPSSTRPPHPSDLVAWFFPLWGVPFVLIGFYMIFGRFFYDSAARNKTWYGITNKRLIILKSLFFSRVNSYDHATLTNLSLVERGDRSGDILFGTPMMIMNAYPNSSFQPSRRYAVPGFYLLPEARQVFSQIQAAQQQARK